MALLQYRIQERLFDTNRISDKTYCKLVKEQSKGGNYILHSFHQKLSYTNKNYATERCQDRYMEKKKYLKRCIPIRNNTIVEKGRKLPSKYTGAPNLRREHCPIRIQKPYRRNQKKSCKSDYTKHIQVQKQLGRKCLRTMTKIQFKGEGHSGTTKRPWSWLLWSKRNHNVNIRNAI